MTEGCKSNDVCDVADAVRSLALEIKGQNEEIKTLVYLHRSIIKWLLVVVCVIALGNKAAEIVNDFFIKSPTAVAQSK